MSGKKDISKDVLSAVNKKTGKPITENAVKKLASGVTSDTMQSEEELRKLIQSVSAMAKVPVSEKTINDIVGAVKKSGMNINNMEMLMKLMLKK
ncbi:MULTISPECIES: stage VI sporulation protein F [Paenibacillus]|uniref:Stage VI sporulation protein F n=1 Tax=Paenibacillus lignilyticus TaxID=1172615 RepID=A0ABS5CF25_9BACL|nr:MULTISPECIES: stage VI sporulation protein F [Paenibacillus]MBP3964456.1 stage VI sporulation protein F [Paenibacillus lignilyticus]SFS81697.1 Stage VI sporulation protein F [Paenibacillus sp. BC26]